LGSLRLVAALLLSAALAGCGSTQSITRPTSHEGQVAVTSPQLAGKRCTLQTTEDMIERWVTPDLPPSAMLLGDVNIALCKATVDVLEATSPMGPGFCTQLARAVDNPGYDVDGRPAAPLREVHASGGPGLLIRARCATHGAAPSTRWARPSEVARRLSAGPPASGMTDCSRQVGGFLRA
jgi:hypothetical protein